MTRPASLLPRLGAFTLDLLPILGYILLLLAIGFAITPGLLHGGIPAGMPNPIVSDLIAFATVILPVILYFTLQESSTRQATWGKRRLGLMVATRKGDRLGFGRALLRSIVKFLPWQIAHTCLFHIPGWPFQVQSIPPWVMVGFMLVYALVLVYLLAILIRPHRAPYDWIAGSRVVRRSTAV